MKNLGTDAIHNVTSTYLLQSGYTYTYTWNITFAAALGDVPELTIEPGDADLSSIGADVAIATIQVTRSVSKYRAWQSLCFGNFHGPSNLVRQGQGSFSTNTSN